MTGLQVCTWVWQLGSCPFSALFYTLFHTFQHPSIPTHLTFSHLPLFSLLFIHLDFCFIFIYSLYSLVFMLFHSLLCFCYLFFFCFFCFFCFVLFLFFVLLCLALFGNFLSSSVIILYFACCSFTPCGSVLYYRTPHMGQTKLSFIHILPLGSDLGCVECHLSVS